MAFTDTQEEHLETKYYKLERLCKWEHVGELNDLLLTGTMSPKKAAIWCRDNGFDISHPKLYEYKELLQTAVAKHITVERLLGIGVPKRNPINLLALGIGDNKNLVRNELQVLDLVIQRGMDALLTNPDIKLETAMKAIELKNKLTGGAHGGFTMHGLDKLRELEQAKFTAMVQVVMKYIPEDKIPELEQALLDAEREYYETQAPELLEEWKRTNQIYEAELVED